MERKQFLERCRWLFLREGFLYLLVTIVVLMCVNVPGVVQSVKIRKLNDLLTGIDMSQMYAFSKGEIPSSAVNWKGLTAYFRTVMKFFPDQEDAEMFLGYCEYYGLGQEETAFRHIQHSADAVPYYFWNIYDTGILFFKKGDFDHAISYLELTLMAPDDKMALIVGNSIVYRQFFSETLNSDIERRVNNARTNAVLLLAAAHYFKKNYDMAGLFAMKGVIEQGILNREPFYFYAGATAMAKGNLKDALSFFERAMKAKSANPLVYRYAADILKQEGHIEEAQKVWQRGQSLPKSSPEFYYPNSLQLEFY